MKGRTFHMYTRYTRYNQARPVFNKRLQNTNIISNRFQTRNDVLQIKILYKSLYGLSLSIKISPH